jgi:hypothetical protein
MLKKPAIQFETKLEQPINMITDIADAFDQTRMLTVADSWFGNIGLWKPLHKKLGEQFNMISRLRSNNNVFQLPGPHIRKGPGRRRKYGKETWKHNVTGRKI